MTLIHAFMLMTGARIQTALTLRVSRFEQEILGPLSEVRISVGPGSGIDTKSDKRFTLFIPLILYDRIRIYARSDRARSRRLRAPGGDGPDQYLFLTQQGAPYYECKAETEKFNPSFKLRHRKRGQTVRVFIGDYVLPYIRAHNSKDFHYRVHDLRASYGMNMSDSLLRQVELGEISLSRAREILATRMGHASTETTDLYLDYRRNMAAVLTAVDDHERYLRHLIQMAWEGTIDGS
jgi:integrase